MHMGDVDPNDTAGNSEPDNGDAPIGDPFDSIPKRVRRDAITFAVFCGAMTGGFFLFLRFLDYISGMIGEIPLAGALWVSIAIAIGIGSGFVLGVLYGDRYGSDVDRWRAMERTREEYEQSEEYLRRKAEIDREYKRSDFYQVFKIWMGFSILVLVGIIAIGIFS